MTMTEAKKRTFIVLVIFAILGLSIIIGGLVYGFRQVGKIIKLVVIVSLILMLLGLVVWAIWYLFIRKEKFDPTYMNKKNLMEAGKISKPDNLNDLYLSGDRGHSRVRTGRIIGYCRIQVMKKLIHYDEKTNEPKTIPHPDYPERRVAVYDVVHEEQDVFTVERHGFPMNLFFEDMVIRVNPVDHNDLVGDVDLFGFSLIPISEYYFLNNKYLDVRLIDFNIMKEAERGIFFHSLEDSAEIVAKAMGLDSEHKKAVESKSLYEIPALQNMQPSDPGRK